MADPRLGIGHGLQDASGKLVGILLMFPASFLAGDRRLRGLCGGAFFVEAASRLQGFMLFRRYLAETDVDFRYATTCNASSGALWMKHGARVVDASRREYMFLLRSGPVVEEVLRRRGMGWLAPALGRIAGGIATPFLRPALASPGLEVHTCRDWDRLADLADRHRNPQVITAERSPRILEWKYSGSPPHSRNQVLLIQDRRGNEGWVSLGESRRGSAGQVRTWTVLDWVSSGNDPFRADMLRAVLGRLSGTCDVIALHGPEWLSRSALTLGARVRQLPCPTTLVHGLSEAGCPEIFPADGDTPVGLGAPGAQT